MNCPCSLTYILYLNPTVVATQFLSPPNASIGNPLKDTIGLLHSNYAVMKQRSQE
jgi:hypothetical protein